jgi:hypothetical protein
MSRTRMIDAFMPKVEELAGRSKGKIRADVAHRKITAMGYRGSERSTRRAGAEVKGPAGRAGGCGAGSPGETDDYRARRAGRRRDHPPPTIGARQPADPGRALPGSPRRQRARQPRPGPRTQGEAEFLAIGGGAQWWLTEATASGAARIRSKMAPRRRAGRNRPSRSPRRPMRADWPMTGEPAWRRACASGRTTTSTCATTRHSRPAGRSRQE